MLDENLPTFRLKPSSDSPLSSLYYFTYNGSDPEPEYLLRRADPAQPEARNKYAIALCDPLNADVVYGEVLVEPMWAQPALSTADQRAQTQAGVAVPATTAAMIPNSFTIQLYNPDHTVTIKMVPGTWNKNDSWEFEIPVQSFPVPTASQLDREQQNNGPTASDLTPRIMFRWKRDGRLSRDMTCYMSGRRVGSRRNKEPDITIALFKASRESKLTIYEPNLNRVEVEDRKGLEIVLLLCSEVIKDLWLVPKSNPFNLHGDGPPAPSAARRKVSTGAAMFGAASNIPSSSTPGIDAETRELQAMLEQEEREREKAEREREKRERAEQELIKKMLEEEEKERRRREAEIEKETERLRKKYGVEGQQLPSERGERSSVSASSTLSPTVPTPPPRPVSAGPYGRPSQGQGSQGPEPSSSHHGSRLLNVPLFGPASRVPQPVVVQQPQSQANGGQRARGKSEDGGKKIHKKKSSFW
ncbi:uncharacterized protein CTHT_0026470 [Thermochaetoides thermophila DSM 1495]|uniref:Uncharacterized protein n=1 Tax=Chaetomium thermophilum (strain DSM 1495 / CBS 144.50 / IMI 039719) TaxID=759272 RepID=G0S6J8_CHATD|nr:hypothetical protein CTHT_0026470 [Thermochaetoides thermophila DSM 1495]EGS20809.1 hypothetical protein CTHT_0026470 [Thermochaetoides thermophila DSM 1495]